MNDVFSPALIRSMARDLSVVDLIRTTSMMAENGQTTAILNMYATWIGYNKDNPLLYAVLFNYSVVLSDANRLTEARECLEQAIALNADFMPAYINLGRIYERLGSIGVAMAQWSNVLTKLSVLNGSSILHKTTALNQMARTLEAANQDESAEEMLRQSLEIDSRQREVAQHYLALRQRQCEWPTVVPWERVSQDDLMRGISPLSIAAYTDDPLYQLAVSWHYNKVDIGLPDQVHFDWPKAKDHSGPLRIGYLSSDLREHAVGHLMAEVLALHDRSAVEVYAYYCGPESDDPMHKAYQDTSDHWLSITGMDDKSAAQRMVDDGIQILVDVNGYTREARYKLVALRPAPVIVNWLGFPGSMGSPYHHYIVADDWIIPEDHELYYSEKVLRLPCYQPTNRQRIVSTAPQSRAEAGLPENAMVYCCFNGVHKITRATFDRWLMILAEVPDSVLWLLSSTDPAQDRLRDYARQRGIDPDRLVFAPKLKNPEHLARYVLADLFLDTVPYGAHTTASDALWMGLPVLTLSGRSFASRVCASLVRSAGTPELICETATDYVERAIAFGLDKASIAPHRKRLQEQRDRCVLFDTPALVRNLETLYAEMWSDFQHDRLPVPDLTNLDVYMEVGSRVQHDEIEVLTIGDYLGWWREMLEKRHRLRPIAPDKRAFS